MIFDVDDKTFDSFNLIVIDGIAGAGKSSKLHEYMQQHGIKYGRYTSTNSLKRDAANRYNMEVKTIAAGLFTTENMKFYHDFKEPEFSVVVCDEILQTSPRIFDWADEFKDRCKIIMLTDSSQLLAPEQEVVMEHRFNEFIKRDDVLYIQIDTTLRARDVATKEMYEELYKDAKSNKSVRFNQLANMFKVVNYSDISYEPDKLFITHTNEIESFIYKDWNLSSRHDLELIAKGRISGKEKFNSYNYPIMSYAEASSSRIQSHLEVANIGSTNRMQGKETAFGTYFIVERTSVVSMRELYTMVTRNWNIDNITLVVIDIEHDKKIATFKGLPIKHEAFLTVDCDETHYVSEKDMQHIFDKNPDTETICYNKDIILCKHNPKIVAYCTSNKKFKPGMLSYSKQLDMYVDTNPIQNTKKSTAGSLIRKDATMNFSYCNEMYSIIDKIDGINHLFGTHRLNGRQQSHYQVDIYSAYMAVLSNCYMPADGFLSYEYDADMINVYLYEGSVLSNKSLITDELKDYVENKNLGKCTYLFSVPRQQGCLLGSILKAKAYKSIEDKKSLKDVHYGYYQKKYLSLSSDKSCYIINEAHKYEILMVVILSTLLYYMMKLNDVLNGNYICIDAVHFDNLENDTIDKIKSVLPEWFDWRIKSNEADFTVYQTYEDLKSKDEVRNDKRNEGKRNKRANMTEEEKAEARAKNAERMRLSRAKKKAEKKAEEA